MTTLIGIKSNQGIEGIVFAADLQCTYFDDGVPDKKSWKKKILFGKGWMLADCGTEYKEYLDFERLLLGKDKNYSQEAVTSLLNRAVQKYSRGQKYTGIHFPEINALNMTLRRKDNEYSDLHELLLAVNGPKLGVWKVDEFGNLKKAPKGGMLGYYVLGSGRKLVEEYLHKQVEQQKVNPTKVTLTKAIDLAYNALRYAQRDIYTSGFDFVVMTRAEIISFGEDLRKNMTKTLREGIKRIKDNYRRV